MDAHWLSLVQVAPFASLLVQTFIKQYWVETQWSSEKQEWPMSAFAARHWLLKFVQKSPDWQCAVSLLQLSPEATRSAHCDVALLQKVAESHTLVLGVPAPQFWPFAGSALHWLLEQ